MAARSRSRRYLADRRQQAARRQREHEQEARDRVLRDAADRFVAKEDAADRFMAKDDARKQFVPKDWIGAGLFFGTIIGGVGWSIWNERKEKGQVG